MPGVHVAIDAVGAKHGGAAMVLCDVVRAALANQEVERLTVFTAPRQEWQFQLPVDSRLAVAEVPWADRSRIGRLWWLKLGLANALRKSGADVVLCLSPGGQAPASIGRAVLIQQSLPFLKEAYALGPLVGRLRVHVLRLAMRQSVRAADLTIVQSATMRSWVMAGLAAREADILVLPPTPPALPECGRAPLSVASMETKPSHCRALYVGSGSTYKNLTVLIEAIRLARKREPSMTLFVTLPESHPATRTAGVVALGALDRRGLSAAYARATVLVMPSLVETVGLPLLEAMEAGVPVLAADRPYAHDACGEAAVYFPPKDPEALCNHLLDLSTNAEKRALQVERGRAAVQRLHASCPYERMVEAILVLASGRDGDERQSEVGGRPT